MKLKLLQPIAFFDLETTGLNIATDRIVEISIVKILPNNDKETKTKLLNPTIPISEESTLIHGITNEDVKDKATFNDVAEELNDFIKDCDLGGYNSNRFDIPLLAEEFLRAGIDFDVANRNLVDVQNIFHKMEQRTLVAAYQFYCNKDLSNAHSALADTTATFEVLKAQLEKYTELKNDMAFLSDFSRQTRNVDLLGRIVYNKKDVEVFNFGKHKGKPVTEVFTKEPSYYSWMMNGDFPLYTKKVLKDIKNKMKPITSKKKPIAPKKAIKKNNPDSISEKELNRLKNKFNQK